MVWSWCFRGSTRKGIKSPHARPIQGSSFNVFAQCLERIPRSAYYLATKVGRYEKDPKLMFDFSAEKTRKSVDTSLKRLGVEYVDVIQVRTKNGFLYTRNSLLDLPPQVHDIEFAPSLDIIINETLPVLEEAVKQGKARFIGVTGYPVSTLKECIERSKVKIDVVLSYTRLSLFDDTLKEYLPFFQVY